MLFYISLFMPFVIWLAKQIPLDSISSRIFQICISFVFLYFCKKHDAFLTYKILENPFFQYFLLECILFETYIRKNVFFRCFFLFTFLFCFDLSNTSSGHLTQHFYSFLINLAFLYQKVRTTLLANLFKSQNEHFFVFLNSEFYRRNGQDVAIGWLFVLYLVYKTSREKKVLLPDTKGPLRIQNRIPWHYHQKLKLSFFEPRKLSKKKERGQPFSFFFQIILLVFCYSCGKVMSETNSSCLFNFDSKKNGK